MSDRSQQASSSSLLEKIIAMSIAWRKGHLHVHGHYLLFFMGDPCPVLEKPPPMGGMEKMAQSRVSLLHQLSLCCPWGHQSVLASLSSACLQVGRICLCSLVFAIRILTLPTVLADATGRSPTLASK